MKESSCEVQRAVLLMLKLLEINMSNFTDAYAADGRGGFGGGGRGGGKGDKAEEEEASRSLVRGPSLSSSCIDQIESCMTTACKAVQGQHYMACILLLLCTCLNVCVCSPPPLP